MTTTSSLRDDTATTPCPVCDRAFQPAGRRRYCSDECRKTAWHRRHQPARPPITVPPAPRPVKASTVYECPSCETRYLGTQYCADCAVFCRRIGHGGLCPNCGEPVAINDLTIDENIS